MARVEYGRVEHSSRSGKFRAIGYRPGGGEFTLGEYDDRGDAAARLQEYVRAEKAKPKPRRERRIRW